MSGCVQRARSIVNRSTPTRASIRLLVPPADDDPISTALANELVENLDAVGIDVEPVYLPRVELYREVLLNGSFEMFLARMPPSDEPDVFRSLLHSLFSEEPGWQNPYRFTNLTLDELLEEQRTRSGDERRDVVHDIVQFVTREHPFISLGYRNGIRAVRTDRFTGWDTFDPHSPLSYYALQRTSRTEQADQDVDNASEESTEGTTLRLVGTDSRVTENFNPLGVEYRDIGTFTHLVYEPLAYRVDDLVPWLADDIDWSETTNGTTAEVTLRPGLPWHDGSELTTDDVVFTYRFLADTSMGKLEQTIPAPRFRGRTSLVDTVDATGVRTVEFSFGESSREVAERALTVPILPEHIWQDKTDTANISGFAGNEFVTEALVWENDEPIGSGPITVDSVENEERITFDTFSEHFLFSEGNLPVSGLTPGLAFDTLEVISVPSEEVALEHLDEDEADATSPLLSPSLLDTVADTAQVTAIESEPGYLYHVGFNTAAKPFSNPHLRTLVARLIDKSYLNKTVFNGHGRAVSNPLDGTDWTPTQLQYQERDPTAPFIGDDGNIDVTAARDAFREHGFEFDDDENLVFR